MFGETLAQLRQSLPEYLRDAPFGESEGAPDLLERKPLIKVESGDEPLLFLQLSDGGGDKPATMETGLTVQVPLFIERGDRLRIDTRTREYQTRV